MTLGYLATCLVAATWSTSATTSASPDPSAEPEPSLFAEPVPQDEVGAEQALFDDAPAMVTGASRRRQTLSQVPASVTVVTGDQLRVYGWDSVAEILSHVRGFYVADDLNYQYVGVRGFMRPGDFNSRVLVLMDGHPLNDPVFLGASIGREVIEPVRIERVEIIRGPGSALYGSSALLGVINIVTRTGPDPRGLDGVGVDASVTGDSLGRGSATVGIDRWVGAETRVALSVRVLGALGSRYNFPELGLDGPTARDQDREMGLRVYGRFEHGPLSVVAGVQDRTKNVPTASYGTLASGGLATEDRELYASALLQLELRPGIEWSGRVGVTSYQYDGVYPYAPEDGGTLADFGRGTQLTVESTIVAALNDAFTLQVGVSGQRSFGLDTWSEYADTPTPRRDLGYATLGLFADLELRLFSGLSLFVGGRLDAYETFGGQASPRVAVVAEPWTGMVLRAGFGTAFRAPNAFELYYVDISRGPQAAPQLSSENLQQLEASAEQAFFGGRAHLGASVFRFELVGIIEGVADADGAITYANVGTARTLGGELWADARLPVLDARMEVSYTAAYAREVDTGAELSASPLHTLSGTADLSLGIEGLRLAAAARYLSERRSADLLTAAPGAFVLDVTVSWRDVVPGLDVALGVENATATTWWAPGSIEHTQSKLPQEGISGWLRLSSVF